MFMGQTALPRSKALAAAMTSYEPPLLPAASTPISAQA
jgi:hypothetical protein